MPSTFVLVAGYAASGKTRVGKHLARGLPCCCYLDKDTLSELFADRLLLALGQPAGDRDSQIYQCEVRPLEYQSLLAAGLEAAEISPAVVLSAPFIHQLTDGEWMAALHRDVSARQLRLRVVWVSCDRASLHRRMIERGSPRDRTKLADWPAYSASLDEQFHERILGEYFVFHNSDNSLHDAEMERLLRYIASPLPGDSPFG
jgi:predicted kinase